jgi:hypothetical protein
MRRVVRQDQHARVRMGKRIVDWYRRGGTEERCWSQWWSARDSFSCDLGVMRAVIEEHNPAPHDVDLRSASCHVACTVGWRTGPSLPQGPEGSRSVARFNCPPRANRHSESSLAPLDELHARHAGNRFPMVCLPPRVSGTTWSAESLAVGLPQ